MTKYCKAAEYLLGAIKFEKNPVTLKTLREKAVEYTARAEALKNRGQGKQKPSKGAGGGDEEDKDSEDDGSDDPLPLTEEESRGDGFGKSSTCQITLYFNKISVRECSRIQYTQATDLMR